MITFTLLSIWAVWKFYVMFAACILVYRQYLKGTLNNWNIALFAPSLISFYFVDYVFNNTILALIWGRSPNGTKTISERFEVYHNGDAPSQFAKDVATFTCEKLLNTVDPSGNHC